MGVWIETSVIKDKRMMHEVTPFVGVWIETKWKQKYDKYITSHPSWVCGLKQKNVLCAVGWWLSHPSWVCGLKLVERCQLYHRNIVTPFVGVWIETWISQRLHGNNVSHPSWVCGLKLLSANRSQKISESHPSWVCGLKHL